MGVLFSTDNVLTPEFRLAFPSVFEPNKYGGKEKFMITMLFPKEQDLQSFKDLMFNCAKGAWGEDRSKWPALTTPIQDGDKKEWDGFADHLFIKASSEYPPGLVNAAREDVIDKSDVYGGCYARAQINAFAWEFGGKHGISFGLQNLQKLRDGDPFGNRANAGAAFDDGYTPPEGFEGDTADDGIFNEPPGEEEMPF